MNTKTITLKGFILYDTEHGKYGNSDLWPEFVFREYDETGGKILVRPLEITVEIPADFDPRPAQIKALEAKRQELQAQFAAAVVEINRQISQLQAIEHTEAV